MQGWEGRKGRGYGGCRAVVLSVVVLPELCEADATRGCWECRGIGGNAPRGAGMGG